MLSVVPSFPHPPWTQFLIKLTSFSLLTYFVATESQFNRNTDIERTTLQGRGYSLDAEKKITAT